MKKLVSCILALVMLTTLCFTLIGCSNDTGKEVKIMDVSCNPAVQFVLNENDVVISVNATNEEGNLILQATVSNDKSEFEGKTASEAGKLFVEVSNELGFVVSGDATQKGGTVNISFSGDTKKATDLFNQVKASVESYLTSEKITVAINKAEAISKAHLEKLVAEVSPYLDEAQIKAMEYGKLVEELRKSHKETAKFYSQELKNAYYQAKADVMEMAKLEALKGHLDTVSQLAVTATMSLYNTAIENLENTRKTLLVDENSVYQKALETFRNAKVEYLKYRKQVLDSTSDSQIATEVKTNLERLDKIVSDAETALINAGTTANASIDTIKATVTTYKEQVLVCIKNASVNANDHIEEIASKQQTAITNFTTKFETDYATAISTAKSNWASMKEQLTSKKD